MNARFLLLAAAVSLAAPLAAGATPVAEAQTAAQRPAVFDGNRARAGGDPVTAAEGRDKRSAEQIAADEQAKSGAAAKATLAAPVPGPDAEIKEVKKDPWLSWPLAIRAGQGALVGLLIGSLFGPIGLVAGPLIGAALFYGVSKYMSWKASKEASDS